MPTVVLFGRNPSTASTPFDVFTILALFFIAIRYISGDYGRRNLFWDGAKGTTVALMITSLADFGMLLLGHGMYGAMPVVLSWLLLLALVPIMRQGARLLMSRAGIWQIPTALIGVSNRSAEICATLSDSLSLGFDVRWLVIEDSTAPLPQAWRG